MILEQNFIIIDVNTNYLFSSIRKPLAKKRCMVLDNNNKERVPSTATCLLFFAPSDKFIFWILYEF